MKTDDNGAGDFQFRFCLEVIWHRRSFSQLSYNALKILQRRYLRKDVNGTIIETPVKLFRRVANSVASAEMIWNNTANVKTWEDKVFTDE